MIRSTSKTRRSISRLAILLIIAFAAFYSALSKDDATRRHLLKQLGEVRSMPGRLTT